MMNHPFLWGAATSSHQVEGNNVANDWWAWEQAGKVKEPSSAACDHFNRFREDIEIVSKLGHNAHRFSLEWSRLEPHENIFSESAFHHYGKVFKELQLRDIEPVVTLNHFTLPQWLAHRGGWANPDSVRFFKRFVQRAIEAYAPYVTIWITLNEPLILLYYGYVTGEWPPGEKSFPDALKAFRHLLQAHIEAYRVIHQHYETKSRDLFRPKDSRKIPGKKRLPV